MCSGQERALCGSKTGGVGMGPRQLGLGWTEVRVPGWGITVCVDLVGDMTQLWKGTLCRSPQESPLAWGHFFRGP